jgi:hypothetical protein
VTARAISADIVLPQTHFMAGLDPAIQGPLAERPRIRK